MSELAGSRFSIIIPCHNDLDGLSACLSGIYQQKGGTSFEVIVVDDCSDMDVSERLKAQYPKVIFIRLKKNSGPGAARNKGIEKAGGQYIAFIDSDVVPNPLWLTSLDAEFKRGAVIICGQVRHSSKFWARLTALTAFGEYQINQNGYRRHCPSVNYAIAADVMAPFSYDETIPFAGEDVVLSTQLTNAGHSIRYLTSAWVLHNPVLSIWKYCRRSFIYGKGFRFSRARCPELSGYNLHRYLGALSSVVLFFIRSGIDFTRLAKLRKELSIKLWEMPIFGAGVLFTRLVYAAGVFAGYIMMDKH
ncbi:MAG TPA: glycosyltransferase family 2 protein [Desulfobacterales bacterium]|nr:glycosyltransferase family 2 protein [Desulfobacterales bacterium]